MRRIGWLLLGVFICHALSVGAREYRTREEVSYTRSENPYALERCKLDLYYPADTSGFPTVVWFHGGGLSGGNKFIPRLRGRSERSRSTGEINGRYSSPAIPRAVT